MSTASGSVSAFIFCARCRLPWDTLSFYFGRLSVEQPLCPTCFNDLLEYGRSWGGGYSEIESRVLDKLADAGVLRRRKGKKDRPCPTN